MATRDEGELSFEQDIKPLFRQKDRDAMLQAFDLFDYDDVVENADAIVGALQCGYCQPGQTPAATALLELRGRRWGRHWPLPVRSLQIVRLGVTRLVVDELVAGRAVPAGFERGAAGDVTWGVHRIGVPGTPVREQPERPRELGALGCQLVGGPGGPLGVGPGYQQSVAFEPFEALGQNVRGDARDQSEKFIEPPRAG
jgi:hypothetical protein